MRHLRTAHSSEPVQQISAPDDAVNPDVSRPSSAHDAAVPASTSAIPDASVTSQTPSPASDTVVVSEDFTLRGKEKLRSVRYNCESQKMTIDFHPKRPLLSSDDVERLLDSVLNVLKKGLGNNHRVRCTLSQDELDIPVSTSFSLPKDLTGRILAAKIAKISQSRRSFKLDSKCVLDFFVVELPCGRGRTIYHTAKEFLSRKKCIIKVNSRDLCLPRAIVLARAKFENCSDYRKLLKNVRFQKQAALNLCNNAGVSGTEFGLEDVAQFEKYLESYQLVIWSGNVNRPAIYYRGAPHSQQLHLFYLDNHFDVVSSLTALLNKPYVCKTCFKGYASTSRLHKCIAFCSLCKRSGKNCVADKDTIWLECPKCHTSYPNNGCYSHHAKKLGPKKRSVCELFMRCPTCKRRFDRSRESQHICYEIMCNICNKWVNRNHLCYMQPKRAKRSTENNDRLIENGDGNDEFPFLNAQVESDMADNGGGNPCVRHRTICFDIETMLLSTGVQKAALVVAHRTCGICENLDITAESECNNCGVNQHIFREITVFAEWLVSRENMNSTVISFNGRGFDYIILTRALFEIGIVPEILHNGRKLIFMSIKAMKIRFIDLLCYIPCKLSDLPETFGISELKKGFFPFAKFTPGNEKYIGPMPDRDMYDPEGMSSSRRREFDIWYDQNCHNEFDLDAELVSYCISDVDILRRASIQFRQLFIELGHLDPFAEAISMSSAINAVFRQNFLKPQTIGLVPTSGYNPIARQSIKARKWLRYMAETQNITIIPEYPIMGYIVDGYVSETNTAMEFLGDVFHANPAVYDLNMISPVSGLPMHTEYEKWLCRQKALLNAGYRVVFIWEKDFDEDREIQNAIASYTFETPLEPRSAMYGGRVSPFKMYHKNEGDETIKYYDICSLYPKTNRDGLYPIKHPDIYTCNFKPMSEYFGLAKIKILPPRGLALPILPARIGKKLLFALCRTCAEKHQNETCEHTVDERAFIGTWATPEINAAVELNYEILEIFEVWDYPNSSDSLFKDFITTFLKVKVENSGWPRQDMSSSEKDKYISDYLRHDHVVLDPAKIVRNSGRRAMGKSFLVVLWGYLGMKNDKTQTKHLTEPSDLFDMLTSPDIKVKSATIVNDDVVFVHYKRKTDFQPTNPKTSIIHAIYTTMYGRLELYKHMRFVTIKRLLYADTDSIIFVHRPDDSDPELSIFLGGLVDELSRPYGESSYIQEFVSTAPKSYAMRIYSTRLRQYTSLAHIKGITLNERNQRLLNFDSLKNLVINNIKKSITTINPRKFNRDIINHIIFNTVETKCLTYNFDKRVIHSDFTTTPYGF